MTTESDETSRQQPVSRAELFKKVQTALESEATEIVLYDDDEDESGLSVVDNEEEDD